MNFTPTQQQNLLSKMGYDGPADSKMMEAFIASSPGAAAKMGKFSRAMQKRTGMAPGGIVQSLAGAGEGEYPVWTYNGVTYTSKSQANKAKAAADSLAYKPTTPAFNTTIPTTPTTADPVVTTPVMPDSGTTTPVTEAPEAPEELNFEDVIKGKLDSSPESYYVNKVDYENNKKFAVAQSEALSTNETVMADPDNYEVVRKGNRYYIEYPDGTSINTGYNGLSNATARAKGLAEGIKARKEAQSQYDTQMSQYNTNLGLYKDYQVGQLGSGQVVDTATAKATLAEVTDKLARAIRNSEADPENETLQGIVEDVRKEYQAAESQLNVAQTQNQISLPTGGETVGKIFTDPTSMVEAATVDKVGAATPEELIATGAGNVDQVREADTSTVDTTATAAVPDAMTATTYDATKSVDDVRAQAEGTEAVTGEVTQLVTPQTMNTEELAQLGLTAPQIEEIRQVLDTGDLQVTPDQLAEAATLANQGIPLPQAIAQTTGQPGEVVAAKFDSATPEVTAVTDYTEVKTGTVAGTVNTNELVDGQGVGLTAEQADTAKADYENKLEAAKTTVGEGELVDAKTAYNLPPTESATLNETVVQDAAKAGEFPTAEAAQSSFESTVEAAQGFVGANELVEAKDIVKVAEAVEATAATMEALNDAAVAQAVSGTLSQAALAIAEQGTVPASATISGQMTKLMEQFNTGTPTWAAGAIRAANAAMGARGLGASSMAGAAIVQASMEAAMPIAQADAQMFMQMELTNLDNRQQVALANAAAQQNIELANLNNQQAVALQNSSNAFALQSQNLTNQQSVVIANAQMKSALQGQILDVYTQTSMANASRYAEINNINLNNEQQTLLQRSAQNLQVDLTNLDATQQTALANLQVQASLRGQELTNEQQMAMLESTQAFQAAEFTANAKQQAILQDASARAAMEGKVLDITQQTSLFNASRIAAVNDINLSNEQQVILQRSSESLQVDLANLSTESQTALANAQLRAALQGKVLDNQQQAAVLNASRYAEVNNLTLTNAQQALMQDANIKASMEGKVLDNQQQAAIVNVSNLIQERGIELNNEQQTRLFNMTNKVNVDMANLSNRQQTALANAQIEAAMRGQELTNAQQTGTLNAARIGEVANINFTADQQRALENSKLAQSVDLANLNSSSAKLLSDAAALTNVDMANLDNRQQAQVQNAQSFLQMDLANLSNEQQTSIFASQSIINSMLSDQAAENAAEQFNAASENQVTQFFADLSANISRFNADQANAMAQFNSGEENANERFNTQLEAARDQFNAANGLIIAQANAKWRQTITLTDTEAQNDANREEAATANAMTAKALDDLWQRERDIMAFAFSAGENAANRNVELILGEKKLDSVQMQLDSQEDSGKTQMYLWAADKIFGGDWF